MSFLEAAKQVAIEAGDFIKTRQIEGFSMEEKSSAFDVVTEVDRASEQLIRSKIKEIAPDHAFLGEEESFGHNLPLAERLEQAKSEPYIWIVDPIDGTNNYVQGITGYTVSIALACYGEITVGVIYDPSQGQLFYAEKGMGAYRNGQPITVSDVDQLNQSVIGTGFPSNPIARAAVLSGLQEVSLHCRTIRSLGSAALHLAYVASGQITAFWENGLNAWDVAAGVLIVQEAGGMASDTRGQAYSLSTSDVFCSNGKIHQDLLQCLR